jgi:hypothetical protein
MKIAALALLLAGSRLHAMGPAPTMAYNVAPRPVIPGLSVRSGEGLGLSLSYSRYERTGLRSGASPAPNPASERVEGSRLTAQLDYEIAPRVTALVSVPWVAARFSADGHGAQSYSALGDVTLLGRYAAWRRGRLAEVSPLLGVKLPTGATSLDSGGARLSATQQPGSGTADLLFGAAAFWTFDRAALYGDAVYKLNGGAIYSFGDQISADLGVNAPLGRSPFSATAELNLESSMRDHSSEPGPSVGAGGVVASTGGTTLYVSPGLQWRAARALALTAGVQLPIYQYANGTQPAASPALQLGLQARLGR